MRGFLLVFFLLSSLHAAIIDRVAVRVGREVITELQIDEEIRVTAFLNHTAINRSDKMRRAAADRLISQLLVKHEMELSRYPLPAPEAVDAYTDQVRSSFPDSSTFDQELHAYDLAFDTLRDHLALQLTVLRFIELRFRPDVSMSDPDARTDEALDRWLQERRKQLSIVFFDKSLE